MRDSRISGNFEARIREYALQELAKSRRRLPQDRYERLVAEVARTWKATMERREEILMREIVRKAVEAERDAEEKPEATTAEASAGESGKVPEEKGADGKGYVAWMDAKNEFVDPKKAKEGFDAFMEGGHSFAELGNREIAHLLSYAYLQGKPGRKDADPAALEKLESKLLRDPEGLMKIAGSWTGKGVPKSIDRLLLIDATDIGIVKMIRKVFERSISDRIEAFANAVPGIRNREALVRAVSEGIRKIPTNDAYFANAEKAVARAFEATGNPRASEQEELRLIADIVRLRSGDAKMSVAEDAAKFPELQDDLLRISQAENTEALERIASDARKRHAGRKDRLAAVEKAVAAAEIGLLAARVAKARVHEPMSEAASKYYRQTFRDGSVSSPEAEARIEADRKTSLELEKLGPRLAEITGSDPSRKAETYTAAELRSVSRKIGAGTGAGDAELLKAVERQIATQTAVKRQVVAIAAGTTYEEVVRLEKSGVSIEDLYARTAKRDPYGPRASLAELAGNGTDANAGSMERVMSALGETAPVGTSVRIDAGFGSDGEVSVTKSGEGRYLVSVGGTQAYECGSANLEAYVGMAKLLEASGLGFLAPYAEDFLRTAALRRGEKTDADNGDLNVGERRELMRIAAEILGMSVIPDDARTDEALVAHFRNRETVEGKTPERRATEAGILRTGDSVAGREAVLARLGEIGNRSAE